MDQGSIPFSKLAEMMDAHSYHVRVVRRSQPYLGTQRRSSSGFLAAHSEDEFVFEFRATAAQLSVSM